MKFKPFIINSFCLLLIFLLIFAYILSNYENDIKESTVSVETTYILNINSKKIHKTDCGTGARISYKNRMTYTGSIDALFENGYTTCGNCFS